MRITKLEVARWHLDVAIRLFLEGDYLSSLTLAGAAEEILGALSKQAGHPVAVDEIAKFYRADTDPELDDDGSKRVIASVLNRGRNQAKHANDPTEIHFEVEQVWPLQMIMRAMPMARRLGVILEREAVMVEWIRAHSEAIQ